MKQHPDWMFGRGWKGKNQSFRNGVDLAERLSKKSHNKFSPISLPVLPQARSFVEGVSLVAKLKSVN